MQQGSRTKNNCRDAFHCCWYLLCVKNKSSSLTFIVTLVVSQNQIMASKIGIVDGWIRKSLLLWHACDSACTNDIWEAGHHLPFNPMLSLNLTLTLASILNLDSSCLSYFLSVTYGVISTILILRYLLKMTIFHCRKYLWDTNWMTQKLSG